MASGKKDNLKTPTLQINGQAIPTDNKYIEDEMPECFGRVGEAWSMDTPGPMSEAIEKIMDVNRRLVSKIEILHMKIDVDSRQREISIKELKEKGNQQLEVKQTEIENLKSDLEQKAANIKVVSKENKQKNIEIQRLQQYVTELKKDVEASKKFADEIQRQLDMVSNAPDTKSNQAYIEKEIEIVQLRAEVTSLKEHLSTLENELSKARNKIDEQQGMIRLMENDRINVQRKFKDDLDKVQQVVRKEIEILRDVMKKQWEEMRELRAQNEKIQQGVREIRKLLLPAQNLQASPAETDLNATSSLPALPAPKNDKHSRGGRKH